MSSSPVAYHALQTRGGIADLSARVKIRLTGADRVRYLNGQVTSNVQKLAIGQTQPACVTTAKGRLCAEILITARPDSLIVDADASLRETLPARFERYIISDDVELADATDDLRLLHLLPPRRGISATDFGTLTHQPTRRFGRDGLDFFLTADEAASLQAQHPLLNDSLLETLRLEAGLPRWGCELTEETLPPEAGLDRTHIDYHKGCYIGQEVISRLKSVGHVNRQLTGFLSVDGIAPTAGATIFVPGEDRPVGLITSTAWSFALERPIALGYLRRGAPASGLLARSADATSPEARIDACPLPFVAP